MAHCGWTTSFSRDTTAVTRSVNFLKNHQEALCKEPRDKVYGLIGLALDASGFCMDYQKSSLRSGLTQWST